ncbi:MAG TPA: M48 family metalloprotease [Clostridia bacterium]|nr:M48 family metalloprotease [Clostridia bacterium]
MKRRTAAIVLALASGAAFFAAGLFSGLEREAVRHVPQILAGALLAAMGLSALSYYAGNRRIGATSVGDGRDATERLKQRAQRDIRREIAHVTLGFLLCAAWYWLCVAAALAVAFFYGASGQGGWGVAALLFALYALFGLAYFRLQPLYASAPEHVLDETEYPLIYQSIDEARRVAGVKTEVRAALSAEGNIGILGARNRAYITLNSGLARILTRHELTQVFLHELAHFYAGAGRDARTLQRWHGILMDIDFPQGGLLGPALMMGPGLFAMVRYMLFDAAAWREMEKRADSFAMERGDPQAYANALAKLKMMGLFHAESCPELRVGLFEGESFTRHYETEAAALFEQYLAKNEARWRALAARELPARLDSHPTLCMRLEALGVAEYDVASREGDEAYRAEQEKLLARADEAAYERISPEYGELRRERYVERFAAIRAYEEAENPRALETRARLEAANAYVDVDDEKAKRAFRSLIADEPYNAYALFDLGNLLLSLYDDEGLALMYRAAELNDNLTEQAYDAIGSYCLKTGNEAELARYREKAVFALQAALDRSRKKFRLSRSDALAPCTLPDAAREEVVSALVARFAGVCARLLLATRRSPGAEEEETHLVLCEAAKDADEEAFRAAVQSAFEYLDMRAEYFTLLPRKGRAARKYARIFLEKVPGCAVWRAPGEEQNSD